MKKRDKQLLGNIQWAPVEYHCKQGLEWVEVTAVGTQAIKFVQWRAQSVSTRCRDKKKEISWTPKKVLIREKEDDIVQELWEGTLRAVSNGSYRKQVGTAASIVTVADMVKHLI